MDLPEDTWIEIQLRLPVKSLLRFRSVCKAWNSRFRNPEFISAHYRKQKDLDGDNFFNSKLVLMRRNYNRHHRPDSLRCSYFFFLSLRHDLGCEVTLVPDEEIRIPCVTECIADFSHISGSCNGVFCLQDDCRQKVALWNPATREVDILPPATEHATISMCLVLAFGYDCKTDDYKVLRSTSYTSTDFWDHQVELYSLRRNTWKEISEDGFDLRYVDSGFNGYVKGMCHMSSHSNIFSFDVADETFTITAMPEFGSKRKRSERYNAGWKLAIYQEFAACIVPTIEDRRTTFDLWALKEVGVKESWIKMLRIGPVLGVHSFLGFWKNDCFFTKTYHNKLAIYDRKTGKIGKQGIVSDTEYGFQLFSYVESLVPINGRFVNEAKRLHVAVQ